ncbi:MAG: hypothetical protein COX81_01325 [Candidatus Magasanikbacteria bacterium CG_4_10_14_0_2_um_filter_37_12]|uniref:LamG-like jellyroll fold domain-containing protein n=1 Tax=Candidatus Magasanikbacteria bacterium CG_4_10_14_0_2_um_filter_37_12 TaxID=1974637 RepID=A0A2M7V8T5_9BACT|nr:MAG: hypothetical protein COX81_01325 [Candidatus Magasanikbacteria bacterium CG_4_10_14_0_2_um_filter_37_12]
MPKKIHYVARSLAFGLCLSLIGFANIYAKEDNFRPAIGDVNGGLAGLERAYVTEDGGLNLTDGEGKTFYGFPIYIPDQVFVSSPIIGYMGGESLNRIMIVSRTSDGSYFVNGFDEVGGKASMETPLPAGMEFYYDPIMLRELPGTSNYLLLASSGGDIFKITIIGPDLYGAEAISINFGHPVALTAYIGKEAFFVTSPEFNRIQLYEKDLNWLNKKTIVTSEPIVYPVAYDGTDRVFGVTSGNKLVGYAVSSGQMISGFPVQLNGTPIGEPVLAQIDTNTQEDELVIKFSDGSRSVYSQLGVLFSADISGDSFLNNSLDKAEPGGGIFEKFSQMTTRVIDVAKKVIVSLFSKMKHEIAAVFIDNEADLLSISISGAHGNLTPAFSANITFYTLELLNEDDVISVQAIPKANLAQVNINGQNVTSGQVKDMPMIVGENVVVIKVTAEDGAIKEYTIVATRATTNIVATHAWSFDENSGCEIIDNTGVSGVLSPSCTDNAPMWSIDAISGTSLYFDGEDDYVKFNGSNLAMEGAVSLEAWIKPESTSNDNSVYMTVASKGLDYELTVSKVGELRVGIINTNNERVAFNTFKQLVMGQWNHVALTYDGTMVKAYINGKKAGEKPQSGNIRNSQTNFEIGKLNNNYHFHGLIDEIKLYDYALSDLDILNYYETSKPSAILNAWSFGEGTGCVAHNDFFADSIYDGSAVHGLFKPDCTSGPTWTTGVQDFALSFDGVDDYINVKNNTYFTSEHEITVGGWFKFNYSDIPAVMPLFMKSEDSTTKSFQMRMHAPENMLFAGFTDGTTFSYLLVSDIDTYILDNTWTHIVLVGDTNGTRVYINGVERASSSFVGNFKNAGNLQIGGGLIDKYFKGSIDEFVFYDRAFNADEITSLYNVGSS